MLLTKIEQLKKLTAKKDVDFSELADKFFQLSEQDDLIKSSHPLKKEDVFCRDVLPSVVQKQFSKSIHITSMLLSQHAPSQMIHGVVFLSNKSFLTVYYFPELLLGLSTMDGHAGTTNMMRINAIKSDHPIDTAGAGAGEGNSIH